MYCYEYSSGKGKAQGKFGGRETGTIKSCNPYISSAHAGHEQCSKMTASFWFVIVLVGSQLYPACLGSSNINNRTEIYRCNLLEKMFEKALISNEENLYILRDAFDFNSHPSRNLMLVNYIVLMGSPFQLYNVTIPWTNSKIYTIIHPAILFTFQSGLLTITYYYLEGVINTPNITLAIIVENESNMTTNNVEVEHVLSTLTKRVNNAAIHVIATA